MSQLTYTTYSDSTFLDSSLLLPESPRPTIYNATSLRSSRSPSPCSAVSSAAPSPRVPSIASFESEETVFPENENENATTNAIPNPGLNSGYVSSRGTAYHVYNNGRQDSADLGRRGDMMKVNVVTMERGRERVREYRR